MDSPELPGRRPRSAFPYYSVEYVQILPWSLVVEHIMIFLFTIVTITI